MFVSDINKNISTVFNNNNINNNKFFSKAAVLGYHSSFIQSMIYSNTRDPSTCTTVNWCLFKALTPREQGSKHLLPIWSWLHIGITYYPPQSCTSAVVVSVYQCSRGVCAPVQSWRVCTSAVVACVHQCSRGVCAPVQS